MHASEETSSSLSESTYELIGESAVLRTDDDSQADGTESLASFDESAPDDFSNFDGTETSSSLGGPGSEHSGDTQDEEIIAHEDITTPVVGISEIDSAATSHTVTQPLAFPRGIASGPDLFRHDRPGSDHNSYQPTMTQYYYSKAQSPLLLQLDSTFRVMYRGSPEYGNAILEKIGEAIAVSAKQQVQNPPLRNKGSSLFNIMPMSYDDSGSSTEVTLMPTLGIQVLVDNSSDTSDGRFVPAQDSKNPLQPNSKGGVLATRHDIPDLAIFVYDSTGPSDIHDSRAASCEALTRDSNIPTISLTTAKRTTAWPTDLDSLYMSVVDTGLKVPLDVHTFLNLDALDLNKQISLKQVNKLVPAPNEAVRSSLWPFIRNGYRHYFTPPNNSLKLITWLIGQFACLWVVFVLFMSLFAPFVAQFFHQPISPRMSIDVIPSATFVQAFTATTVTRTPTSTQPVSIYTPAAYSTISSAAAEQTSYAAFTQKDSSSWPAGIEMRVLQSSSGQIYLQMSEKFQNPKSQQRTVVKIASGSEDLVASTRKLNDSVFELDFGAPNHSYGPIIISVWNKDQLKVRWTVESHHKSPIRHDIKSNFMQLGKAITAGRASESIVIGQALLLQFQTQIGAIAANQANNTAIHFRRARADFDEFQEQILVSLPNHSQLMREALKDVSSWKRKMLRSTALNYKSLSGSMKPRLGKIRKALSGWWDSAPHLFTNDHLSRLRPTLPQVDGKLSFLTRAKERANNIMDKLRQRRQHSKLEQSTRRAERKSVQTNHCVDHKKAKGRASCKGQREARERGNKYRA